MRDLGRIVKDPWKTGPVAIDRRALVAELPAAETVSVRLDEALTAHVLEPGGRAVREAETALIFGRGKRETARVEGDPARLDLLHDLVGGKGPDDVRTVLLPKDLATFEERARDRAELVAGLLAEGRRLVEEVERLVCALYEVGEDLTKDVVAHAIRRAGSPAYSWEDVAEDADGR